MKKIRLFTGLLAVLSLASAPEASSQYNHGFYGLNQMALDAGKLLAVNPNNQAISILETEPFMGGSSTSFNITTTDISGSNLPRMHFYDMSYLGQSYRFRPNTFLHMPINNTYMITGNVQVTMITGNTFETVFSLLLNANLMPTSYHIYTGEPHISSPFVYKIHSTSAQAYYNPWNGDEEVLVYAQITDLSNPANADILLITLDHIGTPVHAHQVYLPSSYANYGLNMNSLEISSLDLRSDKGRFLATGKVEVAGLWPITYTPFILDMELDQGRLPNGMYLHHYYEENLNQVGNTKYHLHANGQEFLYFTYSATRPAVSGCLGLPEEPMVNVLSLDPNGLSPINQREIFPDCTEKNLDRPHLFTHANDDFINVGFSQTMLNFSTGAMEIGAMIAEMDLTPGGFTNLYRYNFLENYSFSFRSADYFPSLNTAASPYIINTTYHGADYRSHIIYTNPFDLQGPCTDFPPFYFQDQSFPHITMDVKADRIQDRAERVPVRWSNIIYNYTDCSFYRPGAENTLTELASAARFSVFPNPVYTDQITIQGSFEQGDQLYLLNAAGQIVHRQTLQEGVQMNIQLPSNLATGIYMIQITHDRTIKHQDKLYLMH